MRFANQPRRWVLLMVSAAAVFALVAGCLSTFFPRDGEGFFSSIVGWLLALPVGLLVYAALEMAGTWALDRPFWQRLPSWGRILLLVMLVSLVVVGTVLLSGRLLELGWL